MLVRAEELRPVRQIRRCRKESAVVFSKDRMELRFEMGFPARGRTIMAKEMQKLVFVFCQELAESCLFYRKWDTKSKSFLEKAVFLADDQKELRRQLKEKGLTGFVANGAMLPRESGHFRSSNAGCSAIYFTGILTD